MDMELQKLKNMISSIPSIVQPIPEVTTEDHPKREEYLRDYVGKFGREALDIPNIDMARAAQAFKMGLKSGSPFYEDLVMNRCITRAYWNYYYYGRDILPGLPFSSTLLIGQVERGEDDEEEEYPRISDYFFSVNMPGIRFAMQDLGDNARWPRKIEKVSSWKDQSRWCVYHENFSHTTENCIGLRIELSHLLSKGYLKDHLGRKGNKIQEDNKPTERAPSPRDAKIVNLISGGSDICGTFYSAFKRHAKESKSEKETRPTRTTILVDKKVITFEEEGKENILYPHHDGLFITLYMANHYLQRILVDGGSSVNITQLKTLNKMNIPKD
ncbi:uncharacterized protein LOC143594736 [Bidens hawaiensis]|uniref:uncharacterized protein LOC143594736 n=1 Tax=Bidens hawaiensis TaxID=980011 RepID=UPI00404ABDDF